MFLVIANILQTRKHRVVFVTPTMSYEVHLSREQALQGLEIEEPIVADLVIENCDNIENVEDIENLEEAPLLMDEIYVFRPVQQVHIPAVQRLAEAAARVVARDRMAARERMAGAERIAAGERVIAQREMAARNQMDAMNVDDNDGDGYSDDGFSDDEDMSDSEDSDSEDSDCV
ncbi:unnamed protein product [Ceratitis capitata]|uniref:(Mediterranean fruit fly) hypothetical protein n=1 Tax=Ceratitis capitata TaxID=7213 RepID=A0A811U756_CERCA|nr:unnamed protein product [Ceratitis capitata]